MCKYRFVTIKKCQIVPQQFLQSGIMVKFFQLGSYECPLIPYSANY